MAEVTPSTNSKDKRKRTRRISTKIDMTPMVDLAFLLITFFMLTTTFIQPKVMAINMPEEDGGDITKVNEKRVLTVILGKENKVFYYQPTAADAMPEVKQTDFSADGIRKVLIRKQQDVQRELGKNAVILVKILDEANYQNMVDIQDELLITAMPVHAIVAITPEEEALLNAQGL